MAWPEKIALVLALAISAGWYVVTAQPPQASPLYGLHGGAWFAAWAPGWCDVLECTALPLWLFMRLVDWTAGGPARRRGRIKARVLN
jgi:hypothetical protein